MEPKVVPNTDPGLVHLTKDAKVALMDECLAAVKTVLATIVARYPPPACPCCVARAAALALAEQMAGYASHGFRTVDDLHRFVDLSMGELGRRFWAVHHARAQDATTTPPAQVH